MLLINRESLEPLPENGVIKGELYSAQTEAAEIIAKAKAEAERIQQEASELAKSERAQAREEGFQEGRARAAQDIFERAAEGVSFFEHMHDEIVALIIRATRSIVGEAVKDELIQTNIERCLQSARGQKFATLKVAPSQVALVESRIESILQESILLEHIDVRGDKKVQPGGCILVSELGVVDATLDTQLDALEASLKTVIR